MQRNTFAVKWPCNPSHREAYSHFTIPRHHAHDWNRRRSGVNVEGARQYFTGNLVYTHIYYSEKGGKVCFN